MDFSVAWTFSFLYLKDKTIKVCVNTLCFYLVWIDNIFTLEKEAIFISPARDRILRDTTRMGWGYIPLLKLKIKLTRGDIFVDSPQVVAVSYTDFQQKSGRPLICKGQTHSQPEQNSIKLSKEICQTGSQALPGQHT